jgi:hypothetical protein
MKKIIYVIVVLLIIGLIISYSKKEAPVDTQTNNPSNVPQDENDGTAATFTGTISAVDTGCFADAECSVTVDGKKVVILTGMRLGAPQEVGTLKGVESIGDIEAKIGSQAKVYAAKTADGSYTLYGSGDYYVEVL